MDQFALENERIQRRRKVADALYAQSLQPMGGTQFAPGGMAVRNSPLEGLAQMVQAYSALTTGKKLDTEEKALGERQRSDIASAMEDYARATSPRPGSSEQIMDEQANGGEGALATITAPPYAPSAGDKRSAAMNLMGRIGDPRDAAKMMVADALKPRELKTGKPGDVFYDPTTGQQQGSIPAAQKYHTVGGALVPEPVAPGQEVKPVYSAPEKVDYNKPFLPDGSPNPAYQEFAIKKAKSGAANINVSTEKKYGEQFAGQIAKADADMRDAAVKAPELAERANQVKQTIATGKIITGAGADIRLQLGKALNLVGASDAETIANTEALASNLASNTMDAIKASGMGGGTGFSNADRDFLEKAKGGKITLEANTISRLADLAHRAAANTAKRWSERVAQIPETALQGTGVTREPIQVPPLFSGDRRGAPRSGNARVVVDY